MAVTKLPTFTLFRPLATNGTVIGPEGAAGKETEPIGRAPSPKPPGGGSASQSAPEKNSTTTSPVCADGTVSEPVTFVAPADDTALRRSGVNRRSFPPMPGPLATLGVGPSPFAGPPAGTRSMPTPKLVSMRFPRIDTDRAPGSTSTPAPPLFMTMFPEIVVGAVAAGSVLRTATPAPARPSCAVPSGVVPIALQVTVVPDACEESEMPSPENRRMMNPLRAVPVPLATVRAGAPPLRPEPSSRIRSVGGHVSHEEPGCVVASIDTCSVTAGSGDSGVMVCAPESGIANVMSSAPGLSFASRMAL